MLDDNLRDVLTIVGVVIGIIALVLTVYGFDKAKKDSLINLGRKGIYYSAILINVYNIYIFFGEELTHRSIFQLSSSIGILVLLLLMASILKILDIQKSLNSASREMLDIQEKKLDIIKLNSKVLLKVCSFIEKVDDKEFKNKYKKEIDEISELYGEKYLRD